MDEHLVTETPDRSIDSQTAALEETSTQYVGRWNHLISTTNWEKGHIISQWRASLMEAGSPPQSYADEAWSRRVGNVSGQHVGRLRRVYEQFSEVYRQYDGLYWSHFQAALDWHDAEMWLQGAVESGWSVAQMRAQRWEALGAPADQKPREEDIITAELDEDAEAIDQPPPDTIDESPGMVHDVGDQDAAEAGQLEPGEVPGNAALPEPAPPAEETADDPVRPFENLPRLPDDLSEAFEAMKLAIVNHKLSGWREISRDDLLGALDALKQLALAPAEK